MTQSLGPVVQDFLVHKRAIGRKYHSEERELRLLVRYADLSGVRDKSAYGVISIDQRE